MSAEAARLAALHRLGGLDTPPDAELDEVVELAARLFDVPTGLITLLDTDRQWFKAKVGMQHRKTSRDIAFCDHTIRQSGVLVVEDATVDARFRDNPLVLGEPHVRFYAGAPLVTSDGAAIGSLCVLGPTARTASAYQQAMLVALADQVVRHLELPLGRAGQIRSLATGTTPTDDATHAAHFRRFLTEGSTGYVETTADGTIASISAAASRMLGYEPQELVGRPARELAHPDHVREVDGALASLQAGTRSSYEATRVFRHRTGRAVPMQCTVSFLPATPDRPASIGAFLVDLTPRVSADSHRLTAEQDRDRVLAAATDAYIAMDPAGVVREWNAAAERIFGYAVEEAVGQELARLIVPEDQREAHSAALRRVTAGGVTALLGRSTELTAQHRDGSPLQVELTPWRLSGPGGDEGYYAFCRDVSERVAARAALLRANELLQQGQEQLRAAFEASASADAVIDRTGLLLDVNPQMSRFLDRDRDQLVQHHITEFLVESDIAEAMSAVTDAGACSSDRIELRFTTGSGRVTWGLLSVAPMLGVPGLDRSALRIESLQASKDLESALARQSTHDPLTGLPNRGLLLERVRQALADADSGARVAGMALRVDGLRQLTSKDGSAVGDKAVEALAERLSTATPDDVTLAHLQPGLFAAVVPAGSSDAARLANHYLEAVSTPLEGIPSTALRASIGISDDSPEVGEEIARSEHLVQAAEDAARVASNHGGNTVVFATPAIREAQRRQQQLEALVRQALADRTVGLAFQPVFDLATGRIVSAEALLRLTDEQGRPVSALDVVTAAEASGQIVDLGRHVLQLAADHAALWQRDHGFLVPIAVNVSAIQLRRASFTPDVLDALERADVPAAALTLELTESVLLASGSAGMDQLVALRDAGVHLAIDDFGTGFASLTYLRDLPATTLKVDRSFVDGIPHDASAMAIVRGVIDLAASFGMDCIAEGIETEAQRDYLAGRGVLGQGYLLSRPTDAGTVSRLIAQHGAQPASAAAPLSLAEARDQAGRRRDTAGQQRDRAGTERDQVSDLRDRVGDQRDLLADRRDEAGDRRDHAADERDDLAEERDVAGTRRDEAAGQRDRDDDAAGATEPTTLDERTHHLHLVRRAAKSDRERASQDREAGASERALAGRDRQNALADRGAGARERMQAEQDRTTASDDRDSGAGERAQSGDDRSTAQADRGASARDRDEAFVDPLTGVHVRGAGLLELDREVARVARTGESLVVAFIDIDGLKAINDSAGHAAGDDVIRNVAQALTASLRSYDLVVRYGGDEFLCTVSGLSVPAAEARLAAASAALAALSRRSSFTAGLAELQPGDTAQTLIARADADLYDKRRCG